MFSRFARKRMVLIVACIVLLVPAAIALVYHLALGQIRTCLASALGPETHIGTLEFSGLTVDLDDVRIPAQPGFPASDELRATHIRIVPQLANLWRTHSADVTRVEVDGGYLAVVRGRQGKLSVVPSLLSGKMAAGSGTSQCSASATLVVLRDLQVDFVDEQIRNPAQRIALAGIGGELGPLHYPIESQRIDFKGEGTVKSVAPKVPDGAVKISGWLSPQSGDSELNTRLTRVDLVALEPYLLRATEAGVRHGTLDLEMQSEVRSGHIKAPGVLTLNQLELSSGGDLVSTFMGVPRQAVIKGLQDRNGTIRLRFELEGNVDDPAFSLREGISLQTGTELARVTGVTIGTVVKGVGSAGQSGLEAGEQIVKGVGSALGDLIKH